MNVAAILQELRATASPDSDVLAAAVANAPALAGPVIADMERVTRGIWPMPEESRLVRNGLHVLAAAGERRILPAFLALLRRPGQTVEWTLGAGFADVSGPLLALIGTEGDALLPLLADNTVAGRVRWPLFRAAAVLAREGRLDRAALLDIIDRFDREDPPPDDDEAWFGWQDAIMLLGLEDRAPRVQQAWQDGRMPDFDAAEQSDWLAALAEIVSTGRLPVEEDLLPLTDPVISLSAPPDEEYADEEYADEEEPGGEEEELPDPAADIALSDEELDWLDGFLVSSHMPEASLNLELMDGYLAAQVVGPGGRALPQLAELALTGGGEWAPTFDSPAQEALVRSLVERHAETLQRRLAAAQPIDPLLYDNPEDLRGDGWLAGFAGGMAQDGAAWDRFMQQRRKHEWAEPLFDLIANVWAEPADRLPPQERADAFAMLPDLLPVLYGTFHRSQPATSQKIGRNDPCPCGSGKKYKKCHGA